MSVAQLADRALVRFAGPDAANLLQNVVTLDVSAVDARGSRYGALLTPQGKILWDFVLHRLDGGYAADLRAEEAEAFAKRMKLYRLRAKVEIEPAPELAVYAEWAGGTPDASREALVEAEKAGNGRFEHSSVIRPLQSAVPASGTMEQAHPADPRLAALGTRWVAPAGSIETDATFRQWHDHRIALAIPEGGVDFVLGDSFPADAGMDSLGGVAFEKGCYVGQEVVSRMRHRGTGRRRIVVLWGAGGWPDPDTEIATETRPLGRLGSSAGLLAIGLVRLDRMRAALDAGEPIYAGDKDVLVSLPAWATYDWPAAAPANATAEEE